MGHFVEQDSDRQHRLPGEVIGTLQAMLEVTDVAGPRVVEQRFFGRLVQRAALPAIRRAGVEQPSGKSQDILLALAQHRDVQLADAVVDIFAEFAGLHHFLESLVGDALQRQS